AGGGAYTVTANLAGNGIISAPVNLPSGGTISPGASIGAISISTLSLAGGANLRIETGNGGAGQIHVFRANGLTFTPHAHVNFTHLGGTPSGAFVLVDYPGSPLADLSGFTPTSGINLGGVSGSLQNNALNTSVDLYLPNPAEVDSQWGVNGNGTWTNNANWT